MISTCVKDSTAAPPELVEPSAGQSEVEHMTELEYLAGIYGLLTYICGFLLFFVVITIFHYCYKFLRIFF